MTSIDLWPPPKQYRSSTQYGVSIEVSIWVTGYEIHPCFPFWDIVFTRFSVFDLWWPQMTFDLHQNNRDELSNMEDPQVKYEIHVSLPEILCLQGFQILTSGDLKWPLTSTKNNRNHLLNIGHLHAKYEVTHWHPSWDMVFTSKCHVHTHTTSPSHRFLWPSARNQKVSTVALDDMSPEHLCTVVDKKASGHGTWNLNGHTLNSTGILPRILKFSISS